jgi:hypothetical protein
VEFFDAVQGCYETWMPGTPTGLRLPAAASIASTTDELSAGGRFGSLVARRYEGDIAYSTDEYLELLCTYSNHLALSPTVRRGLLDCIRELIDGRFGGRVVKRYLWELAFAFRLSGAGAGA